MYRSSTGSFINIDLMTEHEKELAHEYWEQTVPGYKSKIMTDIKQLAKQFNNANGRAMNINEAYLEVRPDKWTVELPPKEYVEAAELYAESVRIETEKQFTTLNDSEAILHSIIESKVNAARLEERKKIESLMLLFFKWMKNQRWEQHSSHEYYYTLEYQSQWPPKQHNIATEEELIQRFFESFEPKQ